MRGCCWPAHKKRLKLIKDFTLCMSYTYSFTEHLNFCKMCFDKIWSGYCFNYNVGCVHPKKREVLLSCCSHFEKKKPFQLI